MTPVALRPSLASGPRLSTRGAINALVVTEKALKQRGYARLSVLNAAHPEIATVALLDAAPDAQQAHLLGRAGCHAVARRDMLSDQKVLREVVALAAIRSVAGTFCAASEPAPAIFTPANLERLLRSIGTVHGPRDLARALGVPVTSLRQQLRDGDQFPPMLLLTSVRVFVAARRLGDSAESAERIGLAVGYGSGPAFYRACRRVTGATPQVIRRQGALRSAAERYRAALAAWRDANRQ